MKASRKTKGFIAALILCCGATAWFSGWVEVEQSRRADTCIRCGAEWTASKRKFRFFNARMPAGSFSETNITSLTKCWSRYALPCQHDWAFHYINTTKRFAKSFGDGFPDHTYPAASQMRAEELASEIEWLDVPNARSNVLNAIGQRNNLLRFVAATTLTDRIQNEEKAPKSWWAAQAKYFVVVTNKELAMQLLDAWEQDSSALQSYSIVLSRDLMDREQR